MSAQLEPDQLAELDSIAGQPGGGAGPAPGPEPVGEIDAGPAPAPAVPAGPPTADLLRPVVALAFAGLAPAGGVSDAEQEGVCEAYGALVDKWWPGGLGSYGPEFNALLITAAVFLPRIKLPRRPEQDGEAPKEPAKPAAPGVAGAGYTVDTDALKPDEPKRAPA